jgi:hypothetical protein
MLDDHERPAAVVTALVAYHDQGHPAEGMDRQGTRHPLGREVVMRCSVVGLSG